MSPQCIREWKESLQDEAEADAARTPDRARGRGHSTDSSSRPKKFHRHTWLTSAQVDEEGGTGGGNRSKEATRKINTWHGPDAYAFGVPVGFLQSTVSD